MKIDKAVEILENDYSDLTIFQMPDFIKAIELGIEALKATRQSRVKWGNRGVSLLPGETED